MNDVYLMVGSYVAVMAILFFVFNFLSGGLLVPLLKVKMSRGKLVLIRIRAVPTDYFRPGKVTEGFLIYKDRMKNNRRIGCPSHKKFVTRSLGVNCMDIDDEKNAVVLPDFSVVTGFDAVKFDNLYTRALMAGAPQDKILLIILIIVAFSLLASIIAVFLLVKMGGKVDLLVSISQASQVVTNSVM